jgi:hypothetical protein
MTGTLYGRGVGPGDPELLTLKAARILGRVDAVLAASSTKNDYSLSLDIVRPHLRPGVEVIRLGFPMTRDREVLESAWEKNAALAADILKSGRDAASSPWATRSSTAPSATCCPGCGRPCPRRAGPAARASPRFRPRPRRPGRSWPNPGRIC